MPSVRVVTRPEVRQLLSMAEAVDLMKEAFEALSSGRANVPQRTWLEIPEHGAGALIMPVAIEGYSHFAVKAISLYPGNPARGLTNANGLTQILDAETGLPTALVDTEALTALRTGAGSGLATRLLARENARVAVLFGAGPQARAQLEGVCAARDIEEAFVLSRTGSSAEALAKDLDGQLAADVRAAPSRAVLARADVICTATTSAEPLFEARELKPGVHINAIGSHHADRRELGTDVMRSARVVVDQRSSCLAEAGDLAIPIEEGAFDASHIHAELGELVAGRAEGRQSDTETTVFRAVGNAVQDLVTACGVLKKAEEQGIGSLLEV